MSRVKVAMTAAGWTARCSVCLWRAVYGSRDSRDAAAAAHELTHRGKRGTATR